MWPKRPAELVPLTLEGELQHDFAERRCVHVGGFPPHQRSARVPQSQVLARKVLQKQLEHVVAYGNETRSPQLTPGLGGELNNINVYR